MLVSVRGLPLLWTKAAGELAAERLDDAAATLVDLVRVVPFDPSKATVTAEDYEKWYTVYVVHPGGGRVDAAAFPEYPDSAESDLCDHVPNPSTVQRYAREHGYQVDAAFLREAVDRWRVLYGLDPEGA